MLILNWIGKDTEKNKLKRTLLIIGIILTIAGISILSFLGIRKIVRMVHLQQLMEENIVIEIPELHIKAPVLEGTDQETLRHGAGHFLNTGTVGAGNFCIAGHSSVIYKEFFNNLKYIKSGMEIHLYDVQKNCYTYIAEEPFIVEPYELWILQDFGDNRVTIITCTDDGTQRLVVIGEKISFR